MSKYYQKLDIKDVIFNDPATIVFWTDGTKTVVKAQEGEGCFDPEKGIAMAIAKKAFGNTGAYFNRIKKYAQKYEEDTAFAKSFVEQVHDILQQLSGNLTEGDTNEET